MGWHEVLAARTYRRTAIGHNYKDEEAELCTGVHVVQSDT